MKRLVMKRAAIMVLLVACGGDGDPNRQARLRREAAQELAERLAFAGGELTEGPLPSASGGPELTSFRVPLEIADETPFEIVIEETTGNPVALLFEVEQSGMVQRIPLGGDGRLRGELAPAETLRAQRRYRTNLALVDASGAVGPGVQVPFNVFVTGDRLAGVEARILFGHTGPVEAIHQRDDGTIATGGSDGLVRLWSDGSPIASIEAHTSIVYDLRLLTTMVVCIGEDGRVAAHELDGELLWEESVHDDVGRALDANDELIVTGAWDGHVVALDPSGAEVFRVDLEDRVNDLALGPDGRIAVALGRFALPGAFVVLDEEGNETHRVPLPEDATALSWLPGGGIAVAFGRGLLRLYDFDFASFSTLENDAIDTFEDVHVSRGLVMAMSLSGRISVWTPGGTLLMRERFEEETFAFFPTDEVAAFGTAQGTAWLFDVDTVMAP